MLASAPVVDDALGEDAAADEQRQQAQAGQDDHHDDKDGAGQHLRAAGVTSCVAASGAQRGTARRAGSKRMQGCAQPCRCGTVSVLGSRLTQPGATVYLQEILCQLLDGLQPAATRQAHLMTTMAIIVLRASIKMPTVTTVTTCVCAHVVRC